MADLALLRELNESPFSKSCPINSSKAGVVNLMRATGVFFLELPPLFQRVVNFFFKSPVITTTAYLLICC